MQKLKIRQGDWVVVCDGRKALVLENAGDEKFLNLGTREVYQHPDPKTHELGTDARVAPSAQLEPNAAPWSRPIGMNRRKIGSCASSQIDSMPR
jgi:protein required for attachment to host cells